MLTILGVIPARGGSKGVLRKNIREVGKLPLIARAVKVGKEARTLCGCVVSTDDDEIASVAQAYGGTVPFKRPAELASDAAPTWSVLRHALEWFEINHKVRVDAVLTLQPTAPLRNAADVDAAVTLFRGHQPTADSLISVCDVGSHHPLTLYTADNDFLKPLVVGINPTTRRQEFPPVYWRNGAIYITRKDLLLQRERVLSDRPLAYVMPVSRSVNIDAPIDFGIAELFLRTPAEDGGAQ